MNYSFYYEFYQYTSTSERKKILELFVAEQKTPLSKVYIYKKDNGKNKGIIITADPIGLYKLCCSFINSKMKDEYKDIKNSRHDFNIAFKQYIENIFNFEE